MKQVKDDEMPESRGTGLWIPKVNIEEIKAVREKIVKEQQIVKK